MKTMTWGSGGSYSSLGSAIGGSVWDDDILFLQVGASTETGIVTMPNQAGYTMIIRGNGDTCNYTYNLPGAMMLQSTGGATGTIIVEYLVFSSTNNASGLWFSYYNQATSFDVIFRYNKLTMSYNGSLTNLSDIRAWRKCEIYGNEFYNARSSISACCIAFPTAAGYIPGIIAIEDNFFRGNQSSSGFCFLNGVTGSITGTGIMRRNYIRDFQANHTFSNHALLSQLTDASNDTYTSYSESAVSATHDELLFDTDNFLSVGLSDPLYGIPKDGSPVYTDCVQTSSIAENVIGLNGIPVNYRAAGPYTPPVQVNPPTGLSATYTGTGVKLTWTDYSPAQSGYEKVNIFYETVPVESAFTTAKATVNGGVEEYTIPYTDLSASPVWYVRLAHGA